VRAAESDPNVIAYAALELKKATDTLNRANAMLANNDKFSDISSVAYVADQQARTAIAIGQAKQQEEQIKSAELERERVKADVRGAEAARARAQASSAQAQANMAQAQASSAQAQAAAAEKRASSAEQQAAAAEATAGAAAQQNAQLRQQIFDLQAKQTDRGILVTLGDVLFEFGRAEIKPTAQTAIAKLAHYLNEHPDRRVLIEGFTDSVGSDSANLTLSQRRSQAVANALRAQGVDPARVSTRGYGEAYPVASNSSTSDRALNRRVEVYISNDNQPVRARG